MTQLAINYGIVGKFNDAAPALESITIGHRTFEMIHDYWHNNAQCGGRPSLMVREPGRRNPFGAELYPIPTNPFRKGSNNFIAYEAWVLAAKTRHMP